MKMTIIIISILVGLSIVFQIYISMSTDKTQTQAYKVIRTEKDFEIRFYPVVTMATITSSAKTYKELGSWGFRKLAGYIFGGNSNKQKIAMTAPVHMDINDSASLMSFVMPAEYHKDNLPKPNDSGVKIETSTAEYVAAIKFGGFVSSEKIKKHIEMLTDILKKNNLLHYGNFRFLGYNPPYQLFGRRNEIIVTLKWNSK
jgi:hypothetical protein